MAIEHGLVRVDVLQHESIPAGAKLYTNVNNTLYNVKWIRHYSRVGFRATISTPEGNKQISVNPEDLLVISYSNLEGEVADTIYSRSRIASWPLKSFKTESFVYDASFSGIVG